MSTKKICINAMGIALFVVLTLCLQVPVFENYYLCLGYIVMMLYSYYFGTMSGTLVGTIGVLVYCILTGGLRGMPGWILGNFIIGLLCGTTCVRIKTLDNKWLKQCIIVFVIVVSTAIGILVVKSMTEVFLYGISFNARVASNMFAFVADVFVLIVGYEICVAGEPVFKRIITTEN